jgi:hypothetical protein
VSTYNETLATALGHTQALRDNPRPDPDLVARAMMAADDLMRWTAEPDAERALTALRAEIAYAMAQEAGRGIAALPESEDPVLAALAPPAAYDGWAAPTGDVLADVDGAAELVTAIAADAVPPAVADRSAVLLARVLGAAGAALRLGVRAPVVVEDRSEPNADLIAALDARDKAEEQAAGQRAYLESQLTGVRGERDRALADTRELRAEIAKLTQQLGQAKAALRNERALAAGPRGVVGDVLRALGSWAPGYDEMDAEELGRTAVQVAQQLAGDLETERRAKDALLHELAGLPGVAQETGPVLVRVKAAWARLRDRAAEYVDPEELAAVVTERDELRQHLETALAAQVKAERSARDLRSKLAGQAGRPTYAGPTPITQAVTLPTEPAAETSEDAP